MAEKSTKCVPIFCHLFYDYNIRTIYFNSSGIKACRFLFLSFFFLGNILFTFDCSKLEKLNCEFGSIERVNGIIIIIIINVLINIFLSFSLCYPFGREISIVGMWKKRGEF